MSQTDHPAKPEYGRQTRLHNIFRRLWFQQVQWTRAFIISTAAGSGDLNAVTVRLFRNPGDFAGELSRFYGIRTATEFARLLTEHLTIAAQLVNNQKTGDRAAASVTLKKWYHNADEIAAFLASVNPAWNRAQWQRMLYAHLKLTENEAAMRMSRKPESDTALYDRIEESAMAMGDFMAAGILKQYPAE